MHELRAGIVSVLALAGVLAVVGCAGSPTRAPTSSQGPVVTAAGTAAAPASNPAGECLPPAELTWADGSLPDGKQFGWVRHFDGHAIYIDPAELFSDDEAIEAAREDGAIGETEGLPNPFYVRDPDADVVRVDVQKTFTLTAIDGAEYPAVRTLSRATLARLYCPHANSIWMYSPPDRLPAYLGISGGIARSATEQYIP